MIRAFVISFFLAVSCYAQDVMAAAGATYSPYADGRKWEGWGALGLRVGTSKVYSYTTVDLQPHAAAVRQGAAYLAYQKGGSSLLALVDAGAQVSSVTLGTFSGGAIVVQRIKGNCDVVVVFRMNAINATAITPEVRAGFGLHF